MSGEKFLLLADLASDLDRRIEEILAAYDVPGAAIAVAKGKEGFIGVFGEKSRSRGGAIKPTTAFNVGSTSKAFCAAIVSILSERGLLSWDDPIRRLVPEFKLKDDRLSDLITLRDLSGNRVGLPRTGICEFGTELAIDEVEIIRRLAFVELAAPLRSRFCYSNIGHTAVAVAASRATGLPYSKLIKEIIFDPLRMLHSAAGRSAERGLEDLAGWHCSVDGRTIEIDPVFTDVHMGSAGLCVSANDALNWLRFQLGDGRFEGHRILSEKALRECHTPQVVVRPEDLAIWIGPPESKFSAYGLGWAISEQAGRRVLRHSGSDFGINAHVSLVPELGAGVAVYINKDCKASIEINYVLLDVLLGLAPRDWRRIVSDKSLPDTNSTFRQVTQRVTPESRLAKPTRRYEGRYFHPCNGPASVSAQNGRLQIQFEDAAIFNADLIPMDEDRFLTVPRYPGLVSDAVSARFESVFSVRGDRAESLDIRGIGVFERSET